MTSYSATHLQIGETFRSFMKLGGISFILTLICYFKYNGFLIFMVIDGLENFHF